MACNVMARLVMRAMLLKRWRVMIELLLAWRIVSRCWYSERRANTNSTLI